MLTVVPQHRVRFEDEMDNYAFSRAQSVQLQKVMGYNERRICRRTDACISDLICHGFEHLFSEGLLAPGEVDALR